MSDLVKNTCERVMNTQLNADERALALQNASASALSDPMASAFFRQFIDSMDIRLASSDSNEQLETRIEEYQQLLADMINGPMYLGWIIEAAVPGFEGANPRALLLTQKGEHSVATYPRSMWENLPQNGDMVLCAGPLVVGSVPTELNAMPSVAMEFVRRLENNLVECKSPEGRVSTHHCVGQMRQILEAQADIETTEEGKEPAVYVEPLKRGDMVYACRLSGAIIARAPVDEERAQGRYVDTTKIPDVVADRDIGKPHEILKYLETRTKILLTRPDILEQFEMRPRVSVLLTGPTGTGKTLTIKAFLTSFRKMIIERIGEENAEKIGSRLIRVKAADLLSKWLGESDKNIEALFDDIQTLAARTVEVDGQEVKIPIIVILEEVEGLTRHRGGEMDSASGGVYDRILNTLLARLDDPTDDLSGLPMVTISTSNRPDLIDAAMMRRLGDRRAHFPRLDREAVAAVLDKKLKPNYPYAGDRSEIVDNVVSHLFNGGSGFRVAVKLRSGGELEKKPQEFLTGALIEQSVSVAIDKVAFAAAEGNEKVIGLDTGSLTESFDSILKNIADTLTPQNIKNYVSIETDNDVVTAVSVLDGKVEAEEEGSIFRKKPQAKSQQ